MTVPGLGCRFEPSRRVGQCQQADRKRRAEQSGEQAELERQGVVDDMTAIWGIGLACSAVRR